MELSLKPIKWEIVGYHEPGYPENYDDPIPPCISSRGPDKNGRERFAITRGESSNLNRRTLEWDHERQPSSRTEQYFKTHRFYSVEEALEVFKKFVVVEKKRYDKHEAARKKLECQ
jgi:hypothetical protein